MITYTNSSNASKYTALFAKATQDLIEAQLLAEEKNEDLGIGYEKDDNGNPAIDPVEGTYIAKDPITTIEKYFFYLPKLVQLGGAVTATDSYTILHSLGRRYAILPVLRNPENPDDVDENVFFIDANKRTIAVPSEFAANGVAVQGDQLAEVVYFEIDRFFDAKDLDDADIFIQWTNANNESGLSAPVVIDIERKPNKIIFGWALSDAITKKDGNISFAVRFYQWADDAKTKLSYSLATQTQQIKINKTLDFTLSETYLQKVAKEMKEENDLLMARIQDGHTWVTENEKALPPIYVFNLRHNELTAYVPKPEGDGFVYVDLIPDGTGKEHYILKAQAKSIDDGIITYDWNYETLDGTSIVTGATIGSDADISHSKPQIVFVESEEERAEDGSIVDKVYYQKTTKTGLDGAAMPVYLPFDITGLKEDESPKSKHLYEKIATLEIGCVGKFYVTATNTKAGSNLATENSDFCIVPMPIDPTIDIQVAEYATIEYAEDKSVELSVKASNNEHNGTKNGNLTYRWEMRYSDKDAEGNPVEFVQVPDAESNKLVIHSDVSPTADPKHVEGFYKVIVSNTKNGQTVETESGICRVSYAATAPVISYPLTDDEVNVSFTNMKPDEVRIDLNSTWTNKWNISDEIQYQWYHSEDLEYDTDPDGGSDQLIEGATESSYTPTERGLYYCVITNIKNHTEASVASRMFYVA